MRKLDKKEYKYYYFQVKVVARGPWLKLDDPIDPVTEESWYFGNDRYRDIAEPWAGSGNDYKPVFRESFEDYRDVFQKIGRNGWWIKKFAELGIERLRKADEIGKFDAFDSYGKSIRELDTNFVL